MNSREAAARKIQGAFRKKRRFVHKVPAHDFALTEPEMTSIVVRLEVAFKDLSKDPLPKGVTELIGYRKTGQKVALRITRNSRIGNADPDDIRRWAFHVTFENPDAKAYVTLTVGGHLQINSTGPYERVLRFLNASYFPGIAHRAVSISSFDLRMYIDRYLRLHNWEDEFIKKVPWSWAHTLYESELISWLLIKVREPKVTYSLNTNGVIRVQGLKRFQDIPLATNIFKEFFTKWNVDPKRVFKYPVDGVYVPRTKIPVIKGKNTGKKRQVILDARYPPALGYFDKMNGYYVRPGPDGKPHFYPLVGDLALVRPKVVRAYANAGIEIPAHVRNTLGISGNAVPLPKTEGRRAPSFNAVKNGFYVKPGPGGQPYFYKVPKGTAAARKTVVAAYQKAGVRIPNRVRQQFGISSSPELVHFPRGHVVNTNAKGQLRINGKQYDRYSKAELVQIARSLNLANVSNAMSLANIAARIRTRAQTMNRPDARVNGVPITILNNGRIKRGTRARQWVTLTANERNAIGRVFVPPETYEEWKTLDTKNKFDALRMFKAQKKASVPAPAPSPANSPNNINFEFELEATLLLGNNASPRDVTRLKNILLALPRGKGGRPLQKTKKNAVNAFMKTLAQEKRKARFAEQIQVPNWLPANSRNAYRTALMNLLMAPNATKEKVRQGISGWLRAHLPRESRAAHNVENVLTGEIRHVPAWNATVIRTPNVPGPYSPVTLASGQAALNAIKTTKGRANWIALRKNTMTANVLKALKNHKKILDQRNKNRRAAAKRTQAN